MYVPVCLRIQSQDFPIQCRTEAAQKQTVTPPGYRECCECAVLNNIVNTALGKPRYLQTRTVDRQ